VVEKIFLFFQSESRRQFIELISCELVRGNGSFGPLELIALVLGGAPDGSFDPLFVRRVGEVRLTVFGRVGANAVLVSQLRGNEATFCENDVGQVIVQVVFVLPPRLL